MKKKEWMPNLQSAQLQYGYEQDLDSDQFVFLIVKYQTLEREMKKMKELFQDKEEELTHLQKNLEREQAEAKENLEDAEAHLKRVLVE